MAPAEERLSDALAGRYTATAACVSACQVTARLSVSAGAARRMGLTARSLAIGSGIKRLGSAGTAAVRVRLSRSAKAALRRRSVTRASLTLTIVDGDQTQRLSRSVALRRDAGLRRIASRGLSLWTICSRACPLNARMTVSAATARKLGLKASGRGRVEIAAGRTSAGTSPKQLRLKVPAGMRRALGRARKVAARAGGDGRNGTQPAPQRQPQPDPAPLDPLLDCEGRRPGRPATVVGVAQSVELLVVVQAVAGSSPVAHPSSQVLYAPGQSGGFSALTASASRFRSRASAATSAR